MKFREPRSRPPRQIGKRGKLTSILFVLVFLFSMLTIPMLKPQPAQAFGPCDLLPGAVAKHLCDTATLGPIGGLTDIPGIPSASGIIGSLAKSAATSILTDLTKQEANTVVGGLKEQVSFANSTTIPDLNSPWFLYLYGVLFGMAVFMGLALWYGRIGESVMANDARIAVKSTSAMIAFLVVGAIVPAAMAGVLKVSDSIISPELMNAAGLHATSALDSLEQRLSSSISSAGDAILLPFFILLIGVIGTLCVHLLLFFREYMLYIVTALEVWGLAMTVGGRWTIQQFQQISLSLTGLVLLKPIMALTFLFGIGLLDANGGADPVILGTLLCALTPFIGWHIYRKVSHHNVRVLPVVSRTVTFTKGLVTA